MIFNKGSGQEVEFEDRPVLAIQELAESLSKIYLTRSG
jgi:hypothetical protein